MLAFGNKTYKKMVLLTSSYFFYGYWDWRFLSLIWISTIVDFMVGKAIYSSFDHKKRKRLLFISIITNLGILGFSNISISSLIRIIIFLEIVTTIQP